MANNENEQFDNTDFTLDFDELDFDDGYDYDDDTDEDSTDNDGDNVSDNSDSVEESGVNTVDGDSADVESTDGSADNNAGNVHTVAQEKPAPEEAQEQDDYVPFSQRSRRRVANAAQSTSAIRNATTLSDTNTAAPIAQPTHTNNTADNNTGQNAHAAPVITGTHPHTSNAVPTGDTVPATLTERKPVVVSAEESEGGVATGTTSKSKVTRKKKSSLFDSSSVTRKESSLDISSEYKFKRYVDGEDGVKKELTEISSQLRKKYHNDPIKAARIINLDVAMKAPDGYFNRYAETVEKGMNFCRPRMADGESAQLLSRANEHPTNTEYQNDAFLSVIRFINDYIATTGYRGIDREIVTNLMVNEMLGFDVLDPLWHDTRVTEIVCNGPYDIQVEIDGSMYKVPSLEFRNREHLERLLEKLFRSVGKTLAQATPQVKGRLHDKSRIFATHHSICPDGPNFNIRRHPEGFWTPEGMIERGAASEEIMTYLGNLIHKGASFIVAGATSSGKALTHDTEIHSPRGIITMGEIAVGDKVFDQEGKVCTVTHKFTNDPSQVYAVKFSTGAVVHADANHNWVTRTPGENEWTVRTTQEIMESGTEESCFTIPTLNRPVQYDNSAIESELEASSYSMGRNGSVLELDVEECLATTPDVRYGFVRGLLAAYGSLLECQEKEFKDTYTYLFSHTDKHAATVFAAIVSSLGNTAYSYVSNGNSNDIDNTTYNVIVTSFKPLTHIPRNERQGFPQEFLDSSPFSSDVCNGEVSIVSVTPEEGRIESMSCITVDSDTSTYMVGDHFTVTHNTSMLNALTGFYPSHSRILTLEDNLELKPNPKKFLAAALETRPPSPDKPNDTGVSMRHLVWGAMQMRPEVLIIGEVTDAAAYDLCQALNTGHAGASTFHANSSQLAITRVASLVAQSGLSTIEGAFDLIAAAFDFVINVRHFPQDGSRRIFSIDEVGTEVHMVDGKPQLKTHPIWRFDESGIDENGNIEGMWTKVGDISPERAERRMFDSQRTLSWDELKELSKLPEGAVAV